MVNIVQPPALQKEILLDGHWSALAQVAEACDLSREEISEAAAKGALWRRKPGKKSKIQRTRHPDTDAVSGDTLILNYDRKVLDQKPQQPLLISDQGNYSIWYKKPGVLSQGSKWSDHCTITATAAAVHGKKCLLVHRLDRAASGLIVLAHTPNACKALTTMFEQRKVQKIYRATVHGKFNQPLPYSIDTAIDGKSALTVILENQYIEESEWSVLKVDIKTGRKHQIRSHLASVGFPVVGDRLFDPDRKHNADLKLIACELKFKCPFNGKLLQLQLDDNLLNTNV